MFVPVQNGCGGWLTIPDPGLPLLKGVSQRLRDVGFVYFGRFSIDQKSRLEKNGVYEVLLRKKLWAYKAEQN